MPPATRWMAFATLLALPGCAMLLTGVGQNVSVVSDPPGAVCSFLRGGEVVAVVNPTPGTAWIARSGRNLTLECTGPGALPTAQRVESRLQAVAIGNMFFGGLLGFAIDAATGALSDYPASVSVVLTPESFATAAARDAFFAARGAEARRRHEERVTAIGPDCAATTREVCDASLAILADERDAELAALEAQRGRAVVTGEAAAPAGTPPPPAATR